MAAGAYTVDEADFGFCQVTEEKLWEVEELYAGNIAMLKDFVSQLADYGLVDQVSPELLAILEDISYVGPPPPAFAKRSATAPILPVEEEAHVSPVKMSKKGKEPAVVRANTPPPSQVPASQQRADEPPVSQIPAPAPMEEVEEPQEEPEAEPEPKGRGGKRKGAAAAGRKKAAPKRKGKAAAEAEVEPEPETEEASQAQSESASQQATQPTPSQEEDDEASVTKKSGRKIRLRKPPPAVKEKELPESSQAPALSQPTRGKRGARGAKAAAESQVEETVEPATEAETDDDVQASQRAVTQPSQGESTLVEPTVAITEEAPEASQSLKVSPPKPLLDRSAATDAAAAPKDAIRSESAGKELDSVAVDATNAAAKRPLDSTRPVSKKPRHELFTAESKPSAMKFPRLADTLSAVDFNIRPSISRETETQIEPLVSDNGAGGQAGAAEIVERAESEALRQDERLQTIIKSSVDKLKGDLSRLKKTTGSSHSSNSNSSSQGAPAPSEPKQTAATANKAERSASSKSADDTESRAAAAQAKAADATQKPPTAIVSESASGSRSESAPKYLSDSHGSDLHSEQSKEAPSSQPGHVFAPSQDSIANSQGFNLIRETMPEASQQSQLSTDEPVPEDRLSMSFFGAISQPENMAGAGTFIPADKESASQKQKQGEIKALAAAASAKEKEEMDRDRRNKMKEQVEEKRREALLRKQQEETKRLEDLKRREDEWKKKAEAPAVRAANPLDKTKDVLEKAKAAEADKLKLVAKDMKSNIPTLNKKPDGTAPTVKTISTAIPSSSSQEKAAAQGPKRPRSPDDATEEARKHPKTDSSASQQTKIVKPIESAAPSGAPPVPSVKIVGPAAPRAFAADPAPTAKPAEAAPKPSGAAAKPIANPILSPGFLAPKKGQPSPQSITELYGGEIPDIPSDESDDDEDRRENQAPVPGWAQTPNLNFSLATQSNLNPEKVFGKVQPLALEDIFQNPTRAHKYHKRTSSGNWGGADRLTQEEEEEYRKAMGFL